MAELSLKSITKRFGKVTALSGVDLNIDDGEFCVLLGPSGCGKSTLLHIIAGLIPQDGGTVLLDGENIDGLAPRDRDFAMVFQSYALYPHMTVAQNLSFGLRMRKVPKETIIRRVRETARFLGIEDLLVRKPRELSGGQRQRVAMGRALARRPRLFLLDEPLSNLDARLRVSVRLELKRLHQHIKSTIVYVTHDQIEAMILGDKVVVMREGRVCQVGRPDAIYSRPADTFVATFIGSPEMNLYRGHLAREGDHTLFKGKGFSFGLGGIFNHIREGEVEVGIRPEDITIGMSGERTALTGNVEMVTDVGSEQHIHARLGDESLAIRAPGDRAFHPGEAISLNIEPERVHVFRNGLRQ
jgi:ABC-type sugar transport system ATPase subunit